MPRSGPGCRTVELDLPDASLTPTDAEGRSIPWQKHKLDDGSTKLVTVYPNNKLGYMTLLFRPTRTSFAKQRRFYNSTRLQSDPLSVSVRTDGTIDSIKADKKQLLAGRSNLWQCTINGERLNPSPVDCCGFVERGIEYAKPGKPFIAYPLIGIATGGASLTISFDCATKCWLDNDGLLHCVVAWGHRGDRFHNRQGPLPGIMGPLSWLKPLDLRLKGKYHLRQTLYPSASIPDETTLLNLSTRATMEPLLIPAETGEDELPWSSTLFHTNLDQLVLLSARKEDNGILLRVLNAHETPKPFRLSKRDCWQIAWSRLLDGKRVAPGALPPWKVVEVLLVPG
ncbi:MAG: hypothetical protein ACUVT8_02485 [Armatimonadota bacterium]